MESCLILVADDDALIREILSGILIEKGYRVETAEDGAAAWEKLAAHPGIQLVVTDLVMPNLTGQDLIRKLRTGKGPDIPVIVLSGNEQVSVAVETLKIGASDYLIKNDNLSETLILAVERALENKRIVDHNRRLTQEITQKNRELTTIIDTMTEIGIAITSEKDFTNLLEIIIERGRALTHADAGTLYLVEDNRLVFKIVQNDTLNIHLGGRSNEEIPFPPFDIQESNVSGYVALNRTLVNIPDVYSSDLFDFTGPRKFDETNGYRTRSMLGVPLINRYGGLVGVLQLINAQNPGTGEAIPFSPSHEKVLLSLGSQAAVAVTNLQFKEKTEKLLEQVLDIKNYNENILESLTNGVITFDSRGRIVKCNAAALQIFSARLEDLAGRTAGEFFARDNPWLLLYIQSVVETGEPIVAMDTELTVDEEKKIPLNLSAIPLRNIKKELIGTMLVMEDITIEKRVKGTLSRYMTEEVAEKLLEEGETMLGGNIQEATILFSDIRHFTTLSEKLGAQETVAMLNDYFTCMVDIVFKFSGILDKYIGDAILAVFGVPFQTAKDPDHAVSAAIEMMNALKTFNRQRMEREKPPLDIGIGINTDEILSGNIGSIKRMDYTCIGDGVNLASRLEGVNKYFGTNILISENTFKKLEHSYNLREIDLIQVKGKNEPVAIYEVMDFHDEESFPRCNDCSGMFGEALALFRERKWGESVETFQKVLALNPNDRASRVYIDRCRHFSDHSPGKDWNGVWVMESK